MINSTKIKIVIENEINRILDRSLGKNNINPNKVALIPTNTNPISGREPPYSCKTDLPDRM
ncbi:hypothetical protein FAQ01_11270 [Flavobacterium aquatile]|nr:hypothetical protein FAQ01_11270 [Flavobacterium aquatile]